MGPKESFIAYKGIISDISQDKMHTKVATELSATPMQISSSYKTVIGIKTAS
ncbi:Nucleoside permease nupC [Yersinia rohdei ATCC 43380]|nr:Nucleoside permease nupC [Yersinia rohdei ATCC 43380]